MCLGREVIHIGRRRVYTYLVADTAVRGHDHGRCHFRRHHVGVFVYRGTFVTFIYGRRVSRSR